MSKKNIILVHFFVSLAPPAKIGPRPGAYFFSTSHPPDETKCLSPVEQSRGLRRQNRMSQSTWQSWYGCYYHSRRPQRRMSGRGGGGRLWLELRGKLVHLRWVDWQVGKRRLRWQKFTRFMSLIVNLETVPKKVALVTNLPIELKTHNQ